MPGRDSGSNGGSSKGKAKMSQAAWDKLSNRQKERDYGGSRFESKKAKSSGSAKESGHQDQGESRRGGWGGGERGRSHG